MKDPPVVATQSEVPNYQQAVVPPLVPRWEELPSECQQGLLVTLSAMLVKQLSMRRLTQQGKGYE